MPDPTQIPVPPEVAEAQRDLTRRRGPTWRPRPAAHVGRCAMTAPPLTADALLRELHDALPADAEARHALEDPSLERAFASAAVEHPGRCTPAGTWTPGGTR